MEEQEKLKTGGDRKPESRHLTPQVYHKRNRKPKIHETPQSVSKMYHISGSR